ncbi:hypothetical protein CkaCkLH20_05093 [Colletotrichum karsti]|uniref:C2H2-type domain-containing protein n=1 Tax=Colletotrichum karsti TaxID=1095194 RepID=A0A9P6LL47_9PEZI|nr:uncharacterized protein CkaCkLH20_05093 [Colletotrichum karsti]KAF9877393.1 hypothetical protein CkaCkLH20_05093 [Colletotrichum karsti]
MPGFAPTVTMYQSRSPAEPAGHLGYASYYDEASHNENTGYDETTGCDEAVIYGEATTSYNQPADVDNTTGYEVLNEYDYNSFLSNTRDEQRPYVEGSLPNHVANPGYLEHFAGGNHFSYGLNDQPDYYSPELVIGDTTATGEPIPTLFIPPPQQQTSPSLEQYANQVRDDPRYQQSHHTSPWDPEGATASQATLTPDYPYDDPYHSRPTSTATRSQNDGNALRVLGYLAPSNEDAASTRSGYTDASTSCSTCGREFNNPRQMRRHQSEVHRDTNAPQYVCKCAYRATRKSNYTRHLDKSCRRKYDPDLVFVCICQEPSNDFDNHSEHIKDCGRQPAGRRPNNARRV